MSPRIPIYARTDLLNILLRAWFCFMMAFRFLLILLVAFILHLLSMLYYFLYFECQFSFCIYIRGLYCMDLSVCVLLVTFYCRLNASWACLLSTKFCIPEAIDEYPPGFVWIPFCWGPSVSLVLDPTFKVIYLCIPCMSMAKVWGKMPSPPSTHLEPRAVTKFLSYCYGSVYSSLIFLTRRIFRVLDLWSTDRFI